MVASDGWLAGGTVAGSGGNSIAGGAASVSLCCAAPLWDASQFFPTVLGVAPAPAELQVDPHRHFEADGLAAEPRDQLALLARRHRAIERVVHLQQRHDALAPAGAHPQLGVIARRALDSAFRAV